MENLQWPLDKIVSVANELNRTGSTAASTSERIAACFVINRMDLLPSSYSDVVDAWDRLGTWQIYVKLIKENHMHLID